MAYIPQEAWIQNATLENNILFNRPKDSNRYQECIKSCALASDLHMLPGGDQTEIGEKVCLLSVKILMSTISLSFFCCIISSSLN